MRNKAPDLRRTIFRLSVAACFAISAANTLATQSPMNSCVNNLHQIDAAIILWALENGVPDTNSCSLTNSQIWAQIRGKELPRCPSRWHLHSRSHGYAPSSRLASTQRNHPLFMRWVL